MKDKKKTGLWKRVAAVLCAVMLVVSCFGSSVVYEAAENDFTVTKLGYCDEYTDNSGYSVCIQGFYNNGTPYERTVYFSSSSSVSILVSKFEEEYSSSNPTIVNKGGVILVYSTTPISYCGNGDANLFHIQYGDNSIYCAVYWDGMYFDKGTMISNWPTFTSVYIANKASVSYDFFLQPLRDGLVNFSCYNSSLGYLKNITKKNLTIDGEDYNPDYDSWRVMFSFDSMSTTGLDITNGEYSVRHFMSWEVRDKDGHIIRTYDKVSCGEYDAVDCKLSYPLYTTRQAAMDECGFESLSWWESGVLGYKVYIYDYLQLVRTNADGSVEYGGYVRIDENGYVADTLDDNFTEDPDGYLDKDVPNSSGSGSNYDDAEHDADNNASGSSGAGSDVVSEINDVLSTVMAVPEIFARMFSFLPDWCLDFLGISVALAGALLVWKVARG